MLRFKNNISKNGRFDSKYCKFIQKVDHDTDLKENHHLFVKNTIVIMLCILNKICDIAHMHVRYQGAQCFDYIFWRKLGDFKNIQF
jgi:hypothetical protein